MMYELEKLRNITLAEKVLRVLAFLRIGPNHPEGKAMKAKISEHLSDDEQGPEQLEPLFQEVTESFLPDYRCSHTIRHSERNSECARLWGKAFISDCECGMCRGSNAVWVGDTDPDVMIVGNPYAEEPQGIIHTDIIEDIDNADITEEIPASEESTEEETVDEPELSTEEGAEWSDTQEDEAEDTDS